MLIAGRLCLIALMLAPLAAYGGPPFNTDDPGIVEAGHVELLPFHSSTRSASGRAGVLAGLEAHFGATRRLEVDLTAPLAFANVSGERAHEGYGDTTLAFKYKLQDESETTPLVSFVPRIDFATGSVHHGLGNGGTQVLLAASVQKTLDPFTAYMTAGYAVNDGAGNRSYPFAGVVIQREFGPHWTLGIEVFGNAATSTALPSSVGFNAGGYYKLDEHGQLLFSAGRGLVHAARTDRVSTYVGYLYAF
jgi:hypothetical protein